MTFTQIVEDIMNRLNLSSDSAEIRVGRGVNRTYRKVTTAIGLQMSRRGTVQANVTMGVSTLVFPNTEKIIDVYNRSNTPYSKLEQVTLDELRDEMPYPASDNPSRWAAHSHTADAVTIEFNRIPQTAFTLYADAHQVVADLSGVQEPAFPESFHDVLIEGTMMDEYRKLEKPAMAAMCQKEFEKLISDLKMWVAKGGPDIYQGKTQSESRSSGSGSGSSSVNGALSYTQTGLITFDRDPSAPFAVTAGSAGVDNLYSLDDDAVNIKAYGAFCDGVQNDNTAILAAIAAGHKRLFLPTNTFWQPTADAVTGGIEYIGENWEDVIIKASNPTTTYISIGAEASLRNVAIWDKVGVDNPAACPDGVNNAPRAIRNLQNLSNSAQVFSHYSATGDFFWVGDGPTSDRGAIAMAVEGVGDGIFIAPIDASVGIQIWPSNGIATDTATGILIKNYGDGNALRIEGQVGGTPATGQIYVIQNSDAPALDIIPSVNTANDIVISHPAKTAGQMIHLFHSTSAYAGTPLFFNMASGSGSFTGDFLTCNVNAAVKAKITAAGRYTGPTHHFISDTSTGTQTNWAIGLSGNTFVQWSGASDVTVTGFSGGVTGQIIVFFNTGSKIAYFAHDTTSTSGAGGNRLFNIATSANTPVAAGGHASFMYNGTFWVMTDHDQGIWITPTFDAAHFTSSAGSWTVASGDVSTMAYRLTGRTLSVSFYILTTSVSGTPDYLKITNSQWGGFTSTRLNITPIVANSAGAGDQAGSAQTAASGTYIELYRTPFATWANATDTTFVGGQTEFEVN